MAKKQIQAITAAPLMESRSYRAERVTNFEWQAICVSKYSDGSYTEERVFKPDVFDIIQYKMFEQIKIDGQLRFLVGRAKNGKN